MDKLQIAAAFPDFWQQFPKAVEVDERQIRFGLFPREWGDLHELQGGERKTHAFWLDCRDSDSPRSDLSWVFSPLLLQPSGESCEDAIGVGKVLCRPSRSLDNFCSLLEEALNGPNSLDSQRERVDEYGWRNFGDVFANHELLHFRGTGPFVSHYNNQFDMIGGFLLQSLRTDNAGWFDLANQLARHVLDIDIYHTSGDRPAYSGGMFWFTDHYLSAQTATHRTYSKRNATSSRRDYGGGPGAEHNFTTGLMLHYLATGYPDSRKAVISLADWVIAMEDGEQTFLGIVDDGPTGLATAGYAKPGRGGANSINALLDAWSLTHEEKYLEFSEELIRRCVHPLDDVAKYDLKNVEVQWSYTMFLSSLAKYLRCKEEAEQLDAMYQYARQTLVNFGKWMFDNEQPYFDQLEKLEFPTEAWAAQELRKANAIRLAARYVEEPLRTKMYDRGDSLGDRAWHDLFGFETRTTARAIAIVMIEGLRDCALRTRDEDLPPSIHWIEDFPVRRPFATQRQRIKSISRSPTRLLRAASRLASPVRWARYGRKTPND